MALVITPDGDFWVPDSIVVEQAQRIAEKAARMVAYFKLEHDCEVPDYAGREGDEALMAEVLAEEADA